MRLDAHHAQSKKWVEAGLVSIFVHGCTCAKSDFFARLRIECSVTVVVLRFSRAHDVGFVAQAGQS